MSPYKLESSPGPTLAWREQGLEGVARVVSEGRQSSWARQAATFQEGARSQPQRSVWAL